MVAPVPRTLMRNGGALMDGRPVLTTGEGATLLVTPIVSTDSGAIALVYFAN